MWLIHPTEGCKRMQGLPQGFLSKTRQRNQYLHLPSYTLLTSRRTWCSVCVCQFFRLSVWARVNVRTHIALRTKTTAEYTRSFISVVQKTQIESPAVYISFTSTCCFRGMDFSFFLRFINITLIFSVAGGAHLWSSLRRIFGWGHLNKFVSVERTD